MENNKKLIIASDTLKRKGAENNNIKINYESIEKITEEIKKEIDELYKNK